MYRPRAKIVKLLERNIGVNDFFLDTKPKAQVTVEKTYIELHQNLKICFPKATIQKIKRQHREWQKIFANYIYDKEFLSRIRNSYNSTIKRQPKRKMGKGSELTFLERRQYR